MADDTINTCTIICEWLGRHKDEFRKLFKYFEFYSIEEDPFCDLIIISVWDWEKEEEIDEIAVLRCEHDTPDVDMISIHWQNERGMAVNNPSFFDWLKQELTSDIVRYNGTPHRNKLVD